MDFRTLPAFKLLRKRVDYCRIRQRFPRSEVGYSDDRPRLAEAEPVLIDWPKPVPKPRIGIVKDYDDCPRWTKLSRFLETNQFEYGFYNIHAHDWLERAQQFDVVVGIWSCELSCLQEMREKYWFLRTYLKKATFPSPTHALLYEDKRLEAYLAASNGIPFPTTYISYDRDDALALTAQIHYPVVSKIVPASSSVGIDLVRDQSQARRIIRQAFSRTGRKTHLTYANQKNYIYFQQYIPNDGYDIRSIVVGRWLLGYYRRALPGDFRASGMGLVEKRALPPEAMQLALQLNEVVKSPMLVVDMLHGLDGKYYLIEYSPICAIESPEQMHVDGQPGVYVWDGESGFRFSPGKYWLPELALRQFLLEEYLGSASPVALQVERNRQ